MKIRNRFTKFLSLICVLALILGSTANLLEIKSSAEGTTTTLDFSSANQATGNYDTAVTDGKLLIRERGAWGGAYAVVNYQLKKSADYEVTVKYSCTDGNAFHLWAAYGKWVYNDYSAVSTRIQQLFNSSPAVTDKSVTFSFTADQPDGYGYLAFYMQADQWHATVAIDEITITEVLPESDPEPGTITLDFSSDKQLIGYDTSSVADGALKMGPLGWGWANSRAITSYKLKKGVTYDVTFKYSAALKAQYNLYAVYGKAGNGGGVTNGDSYFKQILNAQTLNADEVKTATFSFIANQPDGFNYFGLRMQGSVPSATLLIEEIQITMHDYITINLETNGGMLESTTVVSTPGTVPVLPEPKRDGYFFKGWYFDDESFEIPAEETEAADGVTYYAKWRAIDPSRNVSFTFNEDDTDYWTHNSGNSSIATADNGYLAIPFQEYGICLITLDYKLKSNCKYVLYYEYKSNSGSATFNYTNTERYMVVTTAGYGTKASELGVKLAIFGNKTGDWPNIGTGWTKKTTAFSTGDITEGNDKLAFRLAFGKPGELQIDNIKIIEIADSSDTYIEDFSGNTNGLANLAFGTEMTVIAEPDNAENRVIALHKGENQQAAYKIVLPVTLKANTGYALSYRYKASVADQGVSAADKIVVLGADGTAKELGYTVVNAVNYSGWGHIYNKWVERKVQFILSETELGTGIPAIYLTLYCEPANNKYMAESCVYIDDISVVKVPEPPVVEGNLLTNGTFEDSSLASSDLFGGGLNANAPGTEDKWYRNGYEGNSTQYSTERFKTGIGSMKLSTTVDNSYIYYRDIAVKENTSYTFKFSYLVTEAAGNTLCGMIVPTTYYDVNSDNLAYFGSQNSYMNPVVSDSWVDKTITLKTGNNTTIRILFKLIYVGGGATTVYFDDMSLVENVQKVAETPAAPTIETSDKSSVTLTANEAYEYSINGGEWVSDPVFTGLVSGVTYTFTQRAKAYDDYIASPASESIEYLIAVAGDTDGDGCRNSDDLVNLRKELFASNPQLNPYGKDANEDGLIDIRDLVRLKKQIANLQDVKFTICNISINDFNVYSTVTTKIGTQAIDEYISFMNGTFGSNLNKSEQNIGNCIEFVIDDAQDTEYYSVKADGTKLLFTAGSDYKLLDAVRMFISRLSNVDTNKICGIQSGFVLNDSSYSFESENYSLVFNDEFTGTALNSNVWFNAVTPESAKEYDSNNDRNYIDSSAVSVSDGFLKLTSSKVVNENGGTDYIGADLRSRGNVEFGYGYVEIKAKLPQGPNHSAAYWLAGNRTDDKPYASEVDIFETLGRNNQIVPDVHVWYTTDSQSLPEWITNNTPTKVYDEQNKSEFDMSSGYVTDVAEIDSKYHIYGCEWTPESITLYLDGEAYATYDLTSNDVFTSLKEGELLSLAFGNEYYKVSDNETTFPTEYVIDYVRLYQKQNGRLSGKAIADNRDMSWTTHPDDYKLVAFTFDDAPNVSSVGNNTMTKLVDLFNKYNGAASFSVIGYAVNNHGTRVLQYAVDNNFELINHTMHHKNVTNLSYDEIKEDIMGCQNLIKEKMNYDMKFVRTGYLSTSDTLYEVATDLNMPVLGSGGTETIDYNPNTTDEHVKNALLNTYDGRIVLLHCANCVTARYDDNGDTWIEMLDGILAELYSQGFRFVTVSELFKYKGIDNIPTTYTLGDSNVQ